MMETTTLVAPGVSSVPPRTGVVPFGTLFATHSVLE